MTALGSIGSNSSIPQKVIVANTGSSYTIDPFNGQLFLLTMNSATPTLTFSSPPSGSSFLIFIELVQDGTGGRLPTFSNVTYASGVSPTIALSIGAITYLTAQFNGSNWVLFANGSQTSVNTSSIASGSAISLTTNTFATVTSISVTPGRYKLYGCIGFTGQGNLITGTEVFAGIGTATGNSDAGIDYSNIFVSPTCPTVQGDVGGSVPITIVSPIVTTTYYLKAFSLFTVNTNKAYGSITAEAF